MLIFEVERPDQAISRSDIRPGKRKTRRLSDIVSVEPRKGENVNQMLKITWTGIDNWLDVQQPGIYVISHPELGIIYLGLNDKHGTTKRWEAHIKKMLDRMHPSTYKKGGAATKAWHDLSTVIARNSHNDINKASDDLKDILVTYIPFVGTPEELHRREARLRKKLNPYANYDRHTKDNINRPSSTRVDPINPRPFGPRPIE
jgi:hypothetical protein